jgi:hypothetical protein
MRRSPTWVVLAVTLLGACSSPDAVSDPADPLAAGCRLVAAQARLDVAQADAADLRSFSADLDAQADTLSTSDAAELRPMARAAAMLAQAPPGDDRDQARAEYRAVLEATSDVCAASRTAGR